MLASRASPEQSGLGTSRGCIEGDRCWGLPHPLRQQPSTALQQLSPGIGIGAGDAGSPSCRSDAGSQPCPAPCPTGAVRASSIFPILSVGLLFFGGLCVAASEFYKSKHNVILSAGIFFVSAGRSCLAGSGVGQLSQCGRTRGRGRQIVGPPRPSAQRGSGVPEMSRPGGKNPHGREKTAEVSGKQLPCKVAL